MSGDVINIKTVITEVTQKLDTFGHCRTRRPLNGTGRNCSSVAIANNRLLDLDETHVSFRWKDYRESGGPTSKVMRIKIATRPTAPARPQAPVT